MTRYLDPKNDVAFLRVFGQDKNSDILIHFINDILRLKNPIEDIEILHSTQNPDIAYRKQSTIDAFCKDSIGDQYIVEIQVYPQQGFEKRAIFYASRTYCRQEGKDSNNMRDYANLKDVYFIAITNNKILKNKQSYISSHRILDEESGTYALKGLNFVCVELSKFSKTNVDDLDNMIEQWCYFFKYAPKSRAADIQKIIDSNDGIISKAYKELDGCYWTENELDQYERSAKRQADNMSVLLAARDRGFAKGLAKRLEEGEAKERKRSKKKLDQAEQKLIGIVQNLLSMGMDIPTIEQTTGFSESEIIKLQSEKK